jgi:serine/threonine protein kinase
MGLTQPRRHKSTVVLYDPSSKQISLRSLDTDICPTCRRPYADDQSHPDRLDTETASSSMNPAYWNMLQHTLTGLDTEQRSPRIQLPDEVDASSSAPPNAEFVASEPRPSAGISSSAFSPNYFKTFFREERELGRGGKGVVLLVSHYLDNCYLGQFACKRVPVGDDHQWLEKVLLEVQTLQQLAHQNLVQYRHVWLENYDINKFGPTSVPCAFILQQYCDSGDLHHYVLNPSKIPLDKEQLKERVRRRSKGQVDKPAFSGPRRMTFEEIFTFFKDITSGLHHLHSHNFIHRDIKPSNCLLHNTGRRLRVLLSDFGEVQPSDSARKGSGATGTVSYCAPEVLRQQGGAFGDFTVKSDIFSVGMVVYFMCFARLPYSSADNINEDNEDVDKLREEITAWEGFDGEERRSRSDLPERLYQFLKRLLAINPAERPSTEEILREIFPSQDPEEEEFPGPGSLDDRRTSRVSNVDSPTPAIRRHSYQGSANSSFSQPLGPPSPSRSRQLSPPKSPVRNNLTTSSESASSTAIIRARKLESRASPTTETQEHPLSRSKSPHLALPPPPPTVPGILSLLTITQGGIFPTLRIVLFLLKCFSLWTPCRPLSSRPEVAFPLLVLAALDFAIPVQLTYSWWSSGLTAALLGLHLVVIWAAVRMEALCEDLDAFRGFK